MQGLSCCKDLGAAQTELIQAPEILRMIQHGEPSALPSSSGAAVERRLQTNYLNPVAERLRGTDHCQLFPMDIKGNY